MDSCQPTSSTFLYSSIERVPTLTVWLGRLSCIVMIRSGTWDHMYTQREASDLFLSSQIPVSCDPSPYLCRLSHPVNGSIPTHNIATPCLFTDVLLGITSIVPAMKSCLLVQEKAFSPESITLPQNTNTWQIKSCFDDVSNQISLWWQESSDVSHFHVAFLLQSDVKRSNEVSPWERRH